MAGGSGVRQPAELGRRGGGGRGRGGGPRPAPNYKYNRSREEAEEESFSPKDVDYSPSRRLDFHCWFLKGPQDPGALVQLVACVEGCSGAPPGDLADSPTPLNLAWPSRNPPRERSQKAVFDPFLPLPHPRNKAQDPRRIALFLKS